MDTFPETRHSLIARISDARDAKAWEEFLDIYRPMVYRIARRRGWQDADAQDLAQSVLVKIAHRIGSYDPNLKTKFRTWLVRVCQNTLIDEFRKRRPDIAQGGDNDPFLQLPAEPDADEYCLEQRRAVFRWAARQIAQEIDPKTWEAFRRTAIEDEPPNSVAQALGISVGAIYTARSRVMQRLKRKVRDYEDV